MSNSSSRSEQLTARLLISVCRRNIEVKLREDERSASEPQNEEEFSMVLRRRGIRKDGGFKSSVVKEESPDE